MKIDIEGYEWDALKDDPIGVCEARSAALRSAAKADGIAWVFCGAQTGNKLLFMKLSVQKQGRDSGSEGREDP